MMNDARFMRAPTIMQGFHDAGAKVAVVTAKDKLRTLLGNGLDFSSGRAIAFSSEKADKATLAENGIAKVHGVRRQARAGCVFGGSLGIRVRRRRRSSSKVSGPISCICRPRIMCSTRLRRARRWPMHSTPCSTVMSACSMRKTACWRSPPITA